MSWDEEDRLRYEQEAAMEAFLEEGVLPAGVRRPRPVGSGRQIGFGGGDG